MSSQSLQVAILGFQAQVAKHQRIHAFTREHQRHFVNGGHVLGGDDRLFFHVAEERDFRLDLLGQKPVGAAKQNVGLDPDAEQFFHRVLGRLGLEFLRGGDKRHQGHVHEQSVVAAQFLPHLPDRFHERQRLDVAHRAADFDDGDIHILRHLLHRGLDFIGDVGNHLHRFAQIIAAPLLGDDLFVDPAGGPVVVAGKFGVSEAFVVAQVEIGLGPVVGDEDLAMLEGRHGARDRR